MGSSSKFNKYLHGGRVDTTKSVDSPQTIEIASAMKRAWAVYNMQTGTRCGTVSASNRQEALELAASIYAISLAKVNVEPLVGGW